MTKPRIIAWAEDVGAGGQYADERGLTAYEKRKLSRLFRMAQAQGATHYARTSNGGVTIDFIFTSQPIDSHQAWILLLGRRGDGWPSQKVGGTTLYWNPKIMKRESRLVPV